MTLKLSESLSISFNSTFQMNEYRILFFNFQYMSFFLVKKFAFYKNVQHRYLLFFNKSERFILRNFIYEKVQMNFYSKNIIFT